MCSGFAVTRLEVGKVVWGLFVSHLGLFIDNGLVEMIK